MNRFQRQRPAASHSHPSKNNSTLSEQRYEHLLQSARDFFASANAIGEEERQAVIDKIKRQMILHGLTTDDLE